MNRIVLIESYYFDSQGIYACLEDQNIQWSHYSNMAAFLAEGKRLQPDAIIFSNNEYNMDLRRISTSITTVRKRYPHIPVILFTRIEYPQALATLVKQSLFFIISKQDSVNELRGAILRCLAKESGGEKKTLISPYVQSQLEKARADIGMQISRMEQKVINWMLMGMTINDIARATRRSRKTISGHKRNAMKKLGLHNSTAFSRYLATYQA